MCVVSCQAAGEDSTRVGDGSVLKGSARVGGGSVLVTCVGYVRSSLTTPFVRNGGAVATVCNINRVTVTTHGDAVVTVCTCVLAVRHCYAGADVVSLGGHALTQSREGP